MGAEQIEPVFDGRLREAWRHAESGALGAARAALEALTNEYPESGVAWHDLGMCLAAAGGLHEAADAFGTALECAPARADTHHNLGVVLERLGRPDAALQAYAAALSADGTFPDPALALGRLLERGGNAHAAVQAWLRSAVALGDAGRHADAAALLSEAVRVEPDDAGLLGLLGECRLRAGDPHGARAVLERSVALRPSLAEGWHNLGLAAYHAGDLAAARRALARAVRERPVFPQARNSLGNCHARMGDPIAAVREYRYAINQFPNYADAHLNLAQELHLLGHAEEAEGLCERAIALDPDNALAYTTLSWLLLGRGEFTRGWRAFESRIAANHGGHYLPDPRDATRALPTPSSLLPVELAGRRVLLIGSGGLGTEIFFLRFLPQLRAAGCARIEYLTEPRLAPLLRRCGALDAVHVRGGDTALDFDLALSVGELPLVLGHRTGDPTGEPLALAASDLARAAMRARLDALDGPVLAVTWRAGQAADGPRRKAVDPAALARAVRGWPGAVVSLQRAAGQGELEAASAALGRPIADWGDLNDDLDLALAFFEQRPGYVGVSNTHMYLAAAAGSSARVLVKRPLEWRWCGDAPGRSRWFPAFRLYEEHARRGWGPALARLAGDLETQAHPAPTRHHPGQRS